MRSSSRIEADDVKAMLPLAGDPVLVQPTQPVDLSGNPEQQPLEVVGRQLVDRQELRAGLDQEWLLSAWGGQRRIVIRKRHKLLR